MRTLSLHVPGLLPPAINALERMHWAAKARELKRVMDHIWAANGGDLPHFASPFAITIERRYASNPLDLDNLPSSGKLVCDALRKLGAIDDDNPANMAKYTCSQTKVSTVAEQGFLVTITEM